MKKIPLDAFTLADIGPYKEEKSSCSVRAVCSALGLFYPHAYELLRLAGRKHGKACSASVLGKAMGYQYQYVSVSSQRITYATWLRDHMTGTYIVFVTGHFFAVVQGMQHDAGASLYRPRQRMIGYWKIS